MTVWVVRKSLEGITIDGPRRCARPGRIVREPGLLTIEELFAIFLGEGETVHVLRENHHWRILHGNQPAGYLELVDEPATPGPGGDKAHSP